MVELKLTTWLRAEDIGEKDSVLTFLDEGKEISAEDSNFGKECFEITVELADVGKRIWTMNTTSQRAVIARYGQDTKKWVGKSATVYTRKQKVGTKDVEVIYARIPVVKQ